MPISEASRPQLDTLADHVAALLADPSTPHGLARTLRATAKEITLARHHHASQKAWPNGRIDETPTRVQIGGGAHRIDGFFNIDAVPPADLLWDVREGLPLRDATVQVLFSEHFLEHIDYPRSAKHFAREAHRVLAPGGQVITGVPDAAHVLTRYPAPLAEATEMIDRWYANRTCRADIAHLPRPDQLRLPRPGRRPHLQPPLLGLRRGEADPALHRSRVHPRGTVALRRDNRQPEAGVGERVRRGLKVNNQPEQQE